METKVIDVREPLLVCLSNFSGAKGDSCDERKKSLIEPFEALARKMLYGGYLRVGDDYAIFVHTVEFYYHEEKGKEGVRVEDKIVYHRDGRYRRINDAGQSVPVQIPYYPLMSIHSHWSGFDITFENDVKEYRASALLRKYVIYSLKSKKFIRLDTSKKGIDDLLEEDLKLFVGTIIEQDTPYVDKRSQYLAYYLNGFSIEGDRSKVRWIDLKEPVGSELEKPQEGRQNARAHDWAYSAVSPEKYIPQIISSDAFDSVKG